MRTLLLLAIALSAFSAAPAITELQPRGVERGHAFTLIISGRDLTSDAHIWSTLPASFTPVQSTMPGRSIAFLVEPKPEAAPGVYPIRVESSKGISNVLLFSVGAFPEVTEEESQPYSRPNKNDSIETAEPVPNGNITVNGTLRGPERDVFRITGKSGEHRVFEVEARRCGSAIDPTIRLLDASGKQLARSTQAARIDFTFPRDGTYYVEVHDARFSRQTQNFYRLKMSNFAYADTVFPLGGRRGEVVDVTYSGEGLKAVKASVDLRKIDGGLTTAGLPDSPFMNFAVSDLPEFIAPIEGLLPVPSVINARLAKPAAVDRYRVAVEPGEKFLFELQARDLGTSHLEGIIAIYSKEGKKLDSAGDKPLPEDVFAVQGSSRTSNDPFLNFTVPAGVHEITVAIEDLAQRGGTKYAYRLITRRVAEDFQLSLGSAYINIPEGGTTVVSVNADRRGYDGPIQLMIPDLPPGIHLEGGLIPREFIDVNNTRSFNRRGILTLTADPGVALAHRQLIVYGEGKLASGELLRKRARGPGISVDVAGATAQGVVDRQRAVTAPWLGFDLPAAIGEPARATLEVRQTNLIQMAEGGRYEFEFVWNVRSGTPPKDVNVDINGAKDIRVIDMKPGGKGGTFAVTTTKATDPARYDMYITGRLKSDDGDETIISRAIPFVVTEGSSK